MDSKQAWEAALRRLNKFLCTDTDMDTDNSDEESSSRTQKTGQLRDKGAPSPIGKTRHWRRGNVTPLFRSLNDVAKEEQDWQTMEAVRDRE